MHIIVIGSDIYIYIYIAVIRSFSLSLSLYIYIYISREETNYILHQPIPAEYHKIDTAIRKD